MTYKELQSALKTFKAQGLTDIKLNATKIELQTEYDRLIATTIEPEITDNKTTIDTSEIVIDKPLTITPGSFRDIIRQRRPLHSYRHPKAQGFATPKPEKRYDQLTQAEWLNDTLAFLDDMPNEDDDYMTSNEYDEIRYIAYLEYQYEEDEYEYIAA